MSTPSLAGAATCRVAKDGGPSSHVVRTGCHPLRCWLLQDAKALSRERWILTPWSVAWPWPTSVKHSARTIAFVSVVYISNHSLIFMLTLKIVVGSLTRSYPSKHF